MLRQGFPLHLPLRLVLCPPLRFGEMLRQEFPLHLPPRLVLCPPLRFGEMLRSGMPGDFEVNDVSLRRGGGGEEGGEGGEAWQV